MHTALYYVTSKVLLTSIVAPAVPEVRVALRCNDRLLLARVAGLPVHVEALHGGQAQSGPVLSAKRVPRVVYLAKWPAVVGHREQLLVVVSV